MITAALKNKLETLSFRAPSVHNVQPWLLQINEDSLIVFDDMQRVLHIGDPQLHDHEVTLGAFVEGLDLILKSEGLAIAEIQTLTNKEVTANGKKVRARLRLTLTTANAKDVLSDQIAKRRSYRGVFQKSTEADRAALTQAMSAHNAQVVTDKAALKKWAQLYDTCAVRGNANKPYQEELYSWLRMTKSHPHYREDGLNREALALSSLEGAAANFLMKPKVYQKMNQWGLAAALVSEAKQIQSSTGLVFIFKDPKASNFESGRAFYRLWLDLARHDFYACPLSTLVDDVEAKALIGNSFGRVPLNVLRVGRANLNKIYTSPRLKTSDTLVTGVRYED